MMATLWIRRVRRLFALALLLFTLTGTPARAHAELVQADPPPNAILSEPPTQVTLTFDEPVDPNLSTIVVIDNEHAHWEQSDLAVASGDGKTIRKLLRPLASGSYTVQFQVLSASDSHITRGVYGFSVGEPTANVAPSAAVPAAENHPLALIARWIDLLAVLTFSGSLLFRSLVLAPSCRAAGIAINEFESRWRQVFGVAFLIALEAELAMLLLQSLSVTGTVSAASVTQMLLQTRFGFLWLTRWTGFTVIALLVMGVRHRVGALVALFQFLVLAVLYTGILSYPSVLGQLDRVWVSILREGLQQHVVHIAPLSLFVAIVIARDKATRRLITLALTIGMLLTFSLSSHAVTSGNLSLAVLLDWLHITAAAAWVGGLIALFWVLVRGYRFQMDASYARWLALVAQLFSRTALASVTILTFTGLYAASQQVRDSGSLLTSFYGEILYGKVILVLVLVALGAVQLLSVRSRVSATGDGARLTRHSQLFRRLVGAEVLLATLVVGGAGVLSASAPPRASVLTFSEQAPSRTESGALVLFAHPAPDLNIKLSVHAPGPDKAFYASLSGTQGRTVEDIQGVIFEFTLLDNEVGVEHLTAELGEDGRYSSHGTVMLLPGMWEIAVIVRRAGKPNLAAEFPFYVPEPRADASASDAVALDLLANCDAAMNRLTSLQSTQYLNDGTNAQVTTDYEYRAPDRLRFRVNGTTQSIAIGATQYYQQNSAWTVRARIVPFVFPDFQNAKLSAGVKLGREILLDHEPTRIITAVFATSPEVHYAYWVSQSTGRLLRLAMVAPAHYMLQTYYDFDGAVQIEPPR